MRSAVELVGRSGDPAWIPWLLEQMHIVELARLAGQSFAFITGADLAFDDLEGDWPDGFRAGPSEEADDPNVALDTDEDLPWPEPTLVEKWWGSHQRSFTPGVRHLRGAPIAADAMRSVLLEGPQRQRAAAALELARLERRPLFNVRAPAFRQRNQLGLL